MLLPRHGLRLALAVCAVLSALSAARPAVAQLYPKVNYYDASVDMLRDAALATRASAGSTLGALASLQDPQLLPLFQAMMLSSNGPTRVYGVLGCGLVSGETGGIDPVAVLALPSPEERAVVVREANATGMLRRTDVAAILKGTDLEPGTVLTLTGELDRRGEPWDAARIVPIASAQDDAMAGIAALLVLSTGDDAPWASFKTRWTALPEPMRSAMLRALAEGALIFDIQQAVGPLTSLLGTKGVGDDAIAAVIGAALTLEPATGLKLWEERVATRRTQPQLLRAGLQLLTADEKAVPASAFERIRNGSEVLDALANCGIALRTGADAPAALITLIKAGYPVTSEWAMLRARKLPPEQAARVWKYILSTMESANPDDRPTPILLSLAVRELMKSDPAAVVELVDRARTQPVLAISLLTGVYESGSPQSVEIARALRGSLPRAGESLATLILAKGDAPLSEDDFDVLGRAAAGGGDLEAMRAVHAAWYLIKRRGLTADATARISGSQATIAQPSGDGKPR